MFELVFDYWELVGINFSIFYNDFSFYALFSSQLALS
jgi:hypothetical protein